MTTRGYAPLDTSSRSERIDAVALATIATADSSGLPPLVPKLQRHPKLQASAGQTSQLPSETASARPAAHLGMLKLSALTFFAVAGGPFGVEPLVRTGGPGWAALGLLGVPYVWGLPMAMMTAELSTAMPESGGYIIWIHRAFGDYWATQARYASRRDYSNYNLCFLPAMSSEWFIAPFPRIAVLLATVVSVTFLHCVLVRDWYRYSVWTLCNAFLDNAMYPIMFVDYITAFRRSVAPGAKGGIGESSLSSGTLLPTSDVIGTDEVLPSALFGEGSGTGSDAQGHQAAVDEWVDPVESESALSRWLIGMSMTVPIVLLNIRGVDFVGDAAVSFCVLAVTPFVVMVVMGAPALSWSAVSAPAPAPRWGTFLTVLLWNTCGYDSAGTLAAEVAEPGKVYMPAMLICILLSTLVYLGPILVGVSAQGTHVELWVDGYWTDVAEAIGGQWMAGWVMLAGAVSTAGLLNTLLCTTSRALAAMGQRDLMPRVVGKLHSRYSTPYVAIGVMTCAIALLMLSDFETLIEANMMTYILKLLLECTSSWLPDLLFVGGANLFPVSASSMLSMCLSIVMYIICVLLTDAALIKLRLSEPDLPRPYRIPTGVLGLCVLFFPPLALSCGLAYLAQTATLIATIGVLVIGVAVYLILRCWVWESGGAIDSADTTKRHGYGSKRKKVKSSVSVGVNTTALEEQLSQSSDDDEGAGLMRQHSRPAAAGGHHGGRVSAERP